MAKIELGTWVRDAVSGFVGVATARTEYLSGDERIEVTARVQPTAGVDVKLERPVTEWFDAPRLEKVDGQVQVYLARGDGDA